MLHIDIPTLAEFKALAAVTGDTCVSLYVPTEPLREREKQNQLALKDMAAGAIGQMKDAGIDKRKIAAIEEQLEHLAAPDKDAPDADKIRKLQNRKPDPIDDFWKFQGHGLAVLATPKSMRTFRMPYPPKPLSEVSDRFHLAPLIRAMTSPQDIFVLALSEDSVRLLRAFVNLPVVRVDVPDFPADAEQVAHRASLRERPLQAKGEVKAVLHNYARRVDQALRGALAGRSAPLVLAADEPLASIFRSVNSYPGLVDDVILGNPNRLTEAQLEDAALPILDRVYERALKTTIGRYEQLKPQRASTDVSYTAHAVTAGAVEQLVVDLDAVIPGLVSDIDGSVTYASSDDAEVYSVIDEIARRALLTDARVLGARRDALPDRAPLVAILRYQYGPA